VSRDTRAGHERSMQMWWGGPAQLTLSATLALAEAGEVLEGLGSGSMSIQDGARIIDRHALARYGTSNGDRPQEIGNLPFGSAERPDSALLYRHQSEHPSFWTSIFSAYGLLAGGLP
jgi:hypothetical protein